VYFTNSSNDDEEEEGAAEVDSGKARDDEELVVSKNKKLAHVIREGILLLNQSALDIQNNPHTRKKLFLTEEERAELEEPDARQLAEQHRILTTAEEVLEDLWSKGDTSLTITGEPIVLLGVDVRPSLRHADLYWCLPFEVLLTPKLTNRQKHVIHTEMEERLDGPPGRQLTRGIYAVLSGYYAPKIRFKPAPPLMIHQAIDAFVV
jgi:hypothetical protein